MKSPVDNVVEKLWINPDFCGNPVDRMWKTGEAVNSIRNFGVHNPVHNLWKSCG